MTDAGALCIRAAEPGDAEQLADLGAKLFRQAYGVTHPEPTLSEYVASSFAIARVAQTLDDRIRRASRRTADRLDDSACATTSRRRANGDRALLCGSALARTRRGARSHARVRGASAGAILRCAMAPGVDACRSSPSFLPK